MPQMVSCVADPITPESVVTVAELLNRYAPDAVTGPEPASTGPVSVGSLLRREGRAPHAADRPIRSRTADPRTVDEPDDEPRRGSGAFVRRSAIAAGTLLAAGSVLGAAVMSDSSVLDTADDTRASGGAAGAYSGEGRLDLPQGQERAIPTVVDNTAQADRLDPGDAAPMAWTDVAFPRAAAPAAASGPASSAPADARASSPAASTPTGGGSTGGGTTDTPATSNPGSGDRGDDSGATDERSGLGGAVQGVGDTVGGPVGGVVGGLGGTVSGVGDALGSGGPSIVGDLAKGLL